MKDTTQLEFVAVKRPTVSKCRTEGCDGYVHWLHDDMMPKCKQCGWEYWFREVGDDRPTDAQTIAMLEGVVESAKKGAAKGVPMDIGSKSKDIAIVESVPRGEGSSSVWHVLRIYDIHAQSYDDQVEADGVAYAINRAANREANTDAKTIADFEAEVANLRETIRATERDRDTCHRMMIEQSDKVAVLEAERKPPLATPAPPDDAIDEPRAAFLRWANGAWRSAIESLRSDKPKDIAEVVCTGPNEAEVRVDDVVVAEGIGMVCADEIAGAINTAAGCDENADAKTIAELHRQLGLLEATPAPPPDSREAFARTSEAGSDVIVLGGEAFLMHSGGVKRAICRINADIERQRPCKPDTAEPPADSREAFEEWALARAFSVHIVSNGHYESLATQNAYSTWLAALEWRGSKPKRIAEAGPNSGCNLVIPGRGCWTLETMDHRDTLLEAINAGCEESTDGE